MYKFINFSHYIHNEYKTVFYYLDMLKEIKMNVSSLNSN